VLRQDQQAGARGTAGNLVRVVRDRLAAAAEAASPSSFPPLAPSSGSDAVLPVGRLCGGLKGGVRCRMPSTPPQLKNSPVRPRHAVWSTTSHLSIHRSRINQSLHHSLIKNRPANHSFLRLMPAGLTQSAASTPTPTWRTIGTASVSTRPRSTGVALARRTWSRWARHT